MTPTKDYSLVPQIDEQIITTLQDLDEPGEDLPFFEGLIRLYFQEAPMALSKLDKAIEQRDKSAILHFSHKLKGLSRNLGLRRLSEICAAIEHGGETHDRDEQRGLFEKSRAELDQVIVALSRYLQPKPALAQA